MLLNAKVGHFNTEFMGADFFLNFFYKYLFILKLPLEELLQNADANAEKEWTGTHIVLFYLS